MNLPRTNVGRTATQEYGVFPGKSGIPGAARCLAGVIGIAHGSAHCNGHGPAPRHFAGNDGKYFSKHSLKSSGAVGELQMI